MAITVGRAINYEKANIIYKVKIENKTHNSIAEIKIKPYISKDIFIIDQDEKSIGLIKPNEAKTVTFTLRPQGECGNVDIYGKITYYDTVKNKYHDLQIQKITTSVICPMLHRIEITDEPWDQKVSNLISVQEKTKDAPLGKDELFDIVTDVLKDMNMYPLPPKIGIRRNVGKFYCEGVKGLGYAVKVEVIGGDDRSRLILKTYAENEAALVGCYYKILDEIEVRTDIKKYIDDKVVIQHYHGDIVSGPKIDIRDSIVQRSQIGVKAPPAPSPPPPTPKSKCRNCDMKLDTRNTLVKCNSCNREMCTVCESRIKKEETYKGRKFDITETFCGNCYRKELTNRKRLIDNEIAKEQREERARAEKLERAKELGEPYKSVTVSRAPTPPKESSDLKTAVGIIIIILIIVMGSVAYVFSNPKNTKDTEEITDDINPPTKSTISLASTNNDGNYEVTWNTVLGATSYILEEDDNPLFSSLIVVYTGSATAKSIIGKTDGTYYYRVKATNEDGDSPWSEVMSITIDITHPLYPPTITLASTDTDGNYEVSWGSVSNADSYTLEEDDTPSFSFPTEVYTGSATSKLISSKNDSTYYYRVKATNEDNNSGWSTVKSIVIDIFSIVDLNFEWVEISPGSFMMGSDSGDSDVQPVHQVTIAYTFYMLKFEVTQAQWETLMGSNPSSYMGNDNLPVESVSWNDIQQFTTKLNQLDTKNTYRLPSEAEWEYCARAGSTTEYCFGNNTGSLINYAWYYDNSDSWTHIVGQKLPNAWGLYDMHGNVWEWCQDDWYDDYNGAPTDGSAWGNGTGSYRVRRGGRNLSPAAGCRSANRNYDLPNVRSIIGFRLVLEA